MLILAILGFLLFTGLIFGPQIWINWTMRTHAKERGDMPGTGGPGGVRFRRRKNVCPNADAGLSRKFDA